MEASPSPSPVAAKTHRRIPSTSCRCPIPIPLDLRSPSLHPRVRPIPRPTLVARLPVHITAMPLHHLRAPRARSTTPAAPATAPPLQTLLLPIQSLNLGLAGTAVDNIGRLDEALRSAGVSTFLDLQRVSSDFCSLDSERSPYVSCESRYTRCRSRGCEMVLRPVGRGSN